MTGNKLNVDLSYGLKGSYTVEGAIIIPIFIVMLAIAMKMGLVLYNEMKADSSYEYATDMWLVDDFYNYQVLKEVYGNRDKYKDAMAKSGQMDSIATIIDLINSQVKKSS